MNGHQGRTQFGHIFDMSKPWTNSGLQVGVKLSTPDKTLTNSGHGLSLDRLWTWTKSKQSQDTTG